MNAAVAGRSARAEEAIGAINHVAPNGAVSGWALDAQDRSRSIEVYFTVDGAEPRSMDDFVGHVTARINRMDVGPGRHGFVFQLPARFADGLPHAVRAYAAETRDGKLWTRPLGETGAIAFGGPRASDEEAGLSPPPSLP